MDINLRPVVRAALARAIEQHYSGASVKTLDDGAQRFSDSEGDPFEISLPNKNVTLLVSENVLVWLSNKCWLETGRSRLKDNAAVADALIDAMEFDMVIAQIDAAANNGKVPWTTPSAAAQPEPE